MSVDTLDRLSTEQVARWEDLLAYVTDPRAPRPGARHDTPALLSYLLGRAGVAEDEFWAADRNRRSRLLRAGYARPCRDVPSLELSAFDIDKLLKERFRREPLTLGAAWHHGYFRSYFSHAAITHPANDGLREEFSTAWDIVRKRPALVFRGCAGAARRAPRRARRRAPRPADDRRTAAATPRVSVSSSPICGRSRRPIRAATCAPAASS